MTAAADRILLVEDDRSIATVISEALKQDGHVVTHCADIASRDEALANPAFGVMLTDLILPDGDGITSLKSVQDNNPDLPIIILSAQNSLDTAVRASDAGAFEYFPKPFDLDELLLAVRQALDRSGRALPAPLPSSASALPLHGRSPAMQHVFRMITRVMNNDLTVLILGESGTGKELVAEAIHQLGARKTGPFVAVNTAAIPADLIESELFGHEKGAFTGAITQAIGKFEQANGGTLFLDEIGDMPPQAQTRLLRALQSGRIRRVGGRNDIAVDVRIVAATNRDLTPLIAEGLFREDLFYRLNVVPLHLPPLRDRSDDVEPLALHFLMQAEEEGLPRRSFSPEALEIMRAGAWPGNVRELRNTVFRLALLSRDTLIGADLVRLTVHAPEQSSASGAADGLTDMLRRWIDHHQPSDGSLYQEAISAFERPLFEHALSVSKGNQLQAARLLGINRNTLRKRLGELDIAAEKFARRV
ncbi:nitrogen regulation protein NR(I) [Altererythrobacter sp. SALINAS58]|uniref:nitrogen regulation protein NR(I) n=1 Tax=Alteripontixanthobacter muriae TaxID=2705546 RepID=UPI0015753478|nr:nitrogen regulation protein NR(I) [Alteripontixanthobacter muriae]NTZ41662.1 nitrogen regulation protein NR(I) [Alteripontixanthobacter muriae]